jgi:hydrogenase/urease accessory protein HupE
MMAMSQNLFVLGSWGRWIRQAVQGTLLLMGLLVWAPHAVAHLMPAQQGSLHVKESAVLAMVALPVSALSQVDDDGDGRLSDREVQLHLDSIKQQVQAQFRLFNGETLGRLDQLQILAEEDERTPPPSKRAADLVPSPGATHFLMLMKVSFDSPPEDLRLAVDFFGTATQERQLTLKVSRGDDTEAVVLTPWQNQHRFFRSPLHVVVDYTLLGVEHILLGWDHLTFLITVLVAATGWGYWWRVLTGFTLAHSITLTATLLGFLQVPAHVVEPLIAASIVLMAGLNLVQHRAVMGQRLLIVFACGLLHGMGFASAISDLGLHGTYQWTSIVGFNVGIELGQMLFLLAFLALSKGLGTWGLDHRWRQVTRGLTVEAGVSALALAAGLFWLAERLLG